MDSARWQTIQLLFHEVADLPVSEQRIGLKNRCGDDETLISEVLALLQEDAASASMLDRDVAHVVHEILQDEDENSLPFRKFGPYWLKRVLCHGGMGVVYLAERDDLENQVAIKILRDAWLSPARRERFAVEERTLAPRNHHFFARFEDTEPNPVGISFFVSE